MKNLLLDHRMPLMGLSQYSEWERPSLPFDPMPILTAVIAFRHCLVITDHAAFSAAMNLPSCRNLGRLAE
jgi:hypothetical protein